MNIEISKDDAQEVLHKMCVLADTPDLLECYGLSDAQGAAIRDGVPHDGGVWIVPGWAERAVREEVRDHCDVLSGIADDARAGGDVGQALRIAKQAKRLSRLFS